MSQDRQDDGKLGFLDALTGLFRRKEAPPPAQPRGPGRFEQLEADFETAVRRLHEKIEEQRRTSAPTGASLAPAPVAQTAEERAADIERRTESAHRAMREDIEKAHAQLGTGLSGDLEALAGFLRELESVTSPGRHSHAMLPRARYAIGERLRLESGALAVTHLVGLLTAQQRGWPDPTRYRPSASEEEIERSRRRRLGEVREVFLGQGFEKTADRMLGLVRGWGADYPGRGSPLWEECVLEGVAAGIRAQLIREFVELLRRDRDVLLAQVEAAVGKEIQALQGVLEGGVRSVDEASRAMASSFRVLDEVAPEIAWEHVRSQLPRARGELGS